MRRILLSGLILIPVFAAAEPVISSDFSAIFRRFFDGDFRFRLSAPPVSPSDEFLTRYERRSISDSKSIRSLDLQKAEIFSQFSYVLRQPRRDAALTQDVALMVERGSGWLESERGRALLIDELGKVTRILGACGVSISAFHVSEFRMSRELQDAIAPEGTSPYKPPAETGLMPALQAPVRPLMLVIERGSAYAYNRHAIDNLSRQHPIVRILLDITNLGWNEVGTYYQRFTNHPSYSIFAHELVHIFGNVGHVRVDEPNLMNTADGPSAARLRAGNLNAAQCSAIRAYPNAPASFVAYGEDGPCI